jgi:hypothetical protein
MKWYKYPAKISKESNIAFFVIWILSTVASSINNFKWSDLIPVGITFLLSYIAFVYVVYIFIWNKNKQP